MKETQAERILKALQEKNGEWINGRYFNNTMMISQFHTRIHELQKRGHQIEASKFTDIYGFKSYRLVSEALPIRQSGVDAPINRIRHDEPSHEGQCYASPDCCPSFNIFKVHARDCVTLKENVLL